MNQYQKPGLQQFINQWWNKLLFGSKVILGFTILLGIADLFQQIPFELFCNSPEKTFPFYLQRIFFSSYVHYYVIDLIIALFCVQKYFKTLEIKVGSILYLIIIFSLGTIIQLLTVLFQFAFSYLYKPFYSNNSYGLWVFIIVFVVQESIINPNGQSQILFLPAQIKSKLYPLLLIFIFTIIQQSLAFISAGIIGILYYLFSDRIFSFQPSTIEKIEKSGLFMNFFERIDFKRITTYQDQLEPSVDQREPSHFASTPPAKLTIEGSSPFPPSEVLKDLQKQLNNQPESESMEEEKDMQEVPH